MPGELWEHQASAVQLGFQEGLNGPKRAKGVLSRGSGCR